MAFRSALDCFLTRARAQPDAPAILEDGRVVHTYQSLARTALGIGARLQQHGAGPDALVGIAMPKSADFVAALLGTWAAGAAFTALDPALPAARRAVQIREGRIAWVLTSPAHPAAAAPKNLGDLRDPGDLADPADPADPAPIDVIDVIDIGSCHDEPLREPVPCRPEHLAYAFWTSGSTGRPKGVAVEHRGLPGMLAQQIAAFGLGPGQRSLFLLAIGFDASVSDIGTALLSGACLCIESALARPDADTLQALLRARAITYVDIPPSLLALLDPAAAPPGLATVVIGGEVCPVETVRAWARRVRLVNVYGPTEATVCTSLGACTPDWDRPLLGQPLDGVRYRVVDANLREVPDGEPGQLAIGGVQVARGYIAQPALDAARFVALASDGASDGARWFLTGDAVVREPGGAYRYLGRLDRQVKIRGQLAAPEELEAALAAHPAVARAHAHVHLHEHAGRAALIAFVTARAADALTTDSLRAHLAGRLPAWLMPQRIEILDALPETPNGKIDGAALAALVSSARASAAAMAAGQPSEIPAQPGLAGASRPAAAARRSGSPEVRPEVRPKLTPEVTAEVALARAAARVLGRTDVDLVRGFVSLGGDSLSVIEMAAACAAAGLHISASDLAADVPLCDLARGLGTGPAMAASVLDRAAALPADTVAEIARATAAAIAAAGADMPMSLPPSMSAADPAGALPAPRVLLITGATGFLGARLVLELARRSPATLLCLVRARDADHALRRLRAACDAHDPGHLDALGPRVRALPGDIAAPGLGLSAPMYEELAHTVDAVYHCAAQVNMVAPFAALAPHNLHGTAEILRLCLRGARKPLHHASTLSVFVATDRNAGCAEEFDDLGATATVFGGYAQSKWAAERMVQRAAAALPVAVYRLGLITGDPERGALPARDFLTLLTRGLAAIRAVPAAWLDTLSIDITPVSFAAAAMAAIGLGAGGQAAAGTYHIAGHAPVPLRAWVEAMRAAGALLDEVSEEEWHARAASSPAPVDAARAFALLGLCRGAGAGAFAAQRALDMFQATGIRFDSQRADAALSGTGLGRPAATPDLLARYVHRILEEPT